jgi:sporulation protein YlmC with PRC-barrel domain/CBS domain-containing protein
MPEEEAVSLSSLLKHDVIDGEGRPLGKLSDVVTRLPERGYPFLSGLVIGLGKAGYFVPMRDVTAIDRDSILLGTHKVDLRPFERREGELLLKRDVLGHRLIDVAHSNLVKAYDVRLTHGPEGWRVSGLDVHKNRWFHLGRHEEHPARDWHSFMLLLGANDQGTSRSAASPVRKLKPAQIADIIESASEQEQGVLLAQVHEDPQLEASVFEELEDNKQAQLLDLRGDADVAELFARMRADDAADAIMDLPQERRQTILAILPELQRMKILTLLGYNDATAGGLMGPDFLALDEGKTVGDALQQIRSAKTQQPEALTTIYSLREDGTLAGTISLVRALQLEPESVLRDAADRNLIVASPEDDIIAVTTRMADFNLLTLPVVDSDGRMIGVVTVDDALEAAIPRDWARRKAS